MKTRQPLILTARIDDNDLAPFNRLRQEHFPAERNFLAAHVTMFHRLPGENLARMHDVLECLADVLPVIEAHVTGIRHLGMGVAYSLAGAQLQDARHQLRQSFIPWLGSQDMRAWKPHITIQNMASKASSDALFRNLSETFHPSSLRITGFDLWAYLGGPWRLEHTFPFASCGPAVSPRPEKSA